MTLFKTSFVQSPVTGDTQSIATFAAHTKKAIELIGTISTNAGDDEILTLLINNRIAYQDAVDLLVYLPIAFVRLWLKEVKWPDIYTEFIKEQTQPEKTFSENATYQVIWKVTNEYFQKNPTKDTVLKIGGRSADFQAINQLMLDNPNVKLEEISIAETIIFR
ncbi:MAG: hypothetical protein H7Y03_06275 [Chitinophagaceae bacterium]|nr:hypothetical protein [Chitinophagaceae bacterium]